MAKVTKETRYAFKLAEGGEHYLAIKMSKEGEPLETYKVHLRGTHCSCPAHVYCRHQKMLIVFKEQNHIGDGWSYIFETETWLPPVQLAKVGGLYEGLFDDEPVASAPARHLIDI